MGRIGSAQAAAALVVLAAAGASAQELGPRIDLRPGQEVAFAVTLSGDDVALGPARIAKRGATQPGDGEIIVAAAPGGLSPYATLTVTEKTGRPVDFLATGFIDRIKIDEVRLCGNLAGPATARIAAGSRRIALNRFSLRKPGEDCR